MTDSYNTAPPTATPAAGVAGAHQLGQWPHTPHVDAVLTQLRRERARRELTLGAIRAHLEEQPSPYAIRACARRWCTDIAAMAEDVAKNKTEQSE